MLFYLFAMAASAPLAPETAHSEAPEAVAPSTRAIAAANRAWDRGDASKAVALARPLADSGNGEALLLLGRAYELGAGVSADPAEAARLYRRAADAGHVPALAFLGVLYENGTGVAKDLDKANALYREGSDKGDETATYY